MVGESLSRTFTGSSEYRNDNVKCLCVGHESYIAHLLITLISPAKIACTKCKKLVPYNLKQNKFVSIQQKPIIIKYSHAFQPKIINFIV